MSLLGCSSDAPRSKAVAPSAVRPHANPVLPQYHHAAENSPSP